MKRNAGKYDDIAEEAWQWISGQLEMDAPFDDADGMWASFWAYAKEWAEDPENELTPEQAEYISNNLTDDIEGAGDLELWFVKEGEDEEVLGEEVRVPIERIEDWIAGGPNYHGEIGKEPGEEVWVSHDRVIMSSAGFEEGWYTIGLSGTMSDDMKSAIFTKSFWKDVPASYDEDLWQETEGLVEELSR